MDGDRKPVLDLALGEHVRRRAELGDQNREVGRRTDVVGIFPNDRSLVRLSGMLCIEQNDEWLVGRAYLSAESISICLADPEKSSEKEIKKEVPELQPA